MHCVAALDDATSGQVFVGDADLTTLSDKERTLIRRDRIGFVFQAFNLVPTLTAIENITLPMDIAGCKPDKEWLDAVINTVGLATGSITSRASSPAASNEGWPVPARWPAVRTSCSPTNPPATSTRSRARKCWGFPRRSVSEFGRTVVMVTHDPTPPDTRTGCCSWPTVTSSTR